MAPNIIAGTVAVGAAVLLSLIGVQTMRLSWEQKAHAEDNAKHARELKAQSDRALAAEKEAREEGERRVTAMQEIVNETQKALDSAKSERDSAADAGRRLREQYDRIASRRCPRSVHPAAAASSPPADPTDDLLADVRRRLEEAENATIGFADKSRIAGLACERSYDSLDKEAQP